MGGPGGAGTGWTESDCRGNGGGVGRFEGSFAERKEQQLVLLLVRQLAAAQQAPAATPLMERLWQEVAALEIDPERITALLYGGHDVTDRQVLQTLDDAWRHCSVPRRQGVGWWPSRRRSLRSPAGGGHRSAPPAAAQARRAAG
ncbi:hypothetical protein [Vulcanococcus limneticus]|uniref:hypothetical protein n=1 Tax=Vulcanococcus limneticus TaxID=2170428 RepID=UPI00398BE8A3